VLGQNAPIEAAVDAFRRAQFGINDIMRRAQGDAVEAFGLGPSESDHRIVASALASPRLRRSRCIALRASCRSPDQAPVHLGPCSFGERDPALSAT